MLRALLIALVTAIWAAAAAADQPPVTRLYFLEDEQGNAIDSVCIAPLYVKHTSDWMGTTKAYDDGKYYLRWPVSIGKGESFSKIKTDSTHWVFTITTYHWVRLLMLKPGYTAQVLSLDAAEFLPTIRWMERGDSSVELEELLSPATTQERLHQLFATGDDAWRTFPIENGFGQEDREALRNCYQANQSPADLPVAVPPAPHRPKIASASQFASVLVSPTFRWSFTHFCVPGKEMDVSALTNKDYVEGLLAVWKDRWEEGIAARARGDGDAAASLKAHINHELVDAYIPGRIERDSAGDIVRIKDCDELGNLRGILREERNRSRHNFLDGMWALDRGGPANERAWRFSLEIGRLWREKRPFDEVAAVLLAGPLKFSGQQLSRPVGQ